MLSINLNNAKCAVQGSDDGFLMGSGELLNGLPGQHVPPPPPPRATNGRMQPPPPPPSSQAGTFQARVQQKKVIASLLQRGPRSVDRTTRLLAPSFAHVALH